LTSRILAGFSFRIKKNVAVFVTIRAMAYKLTKSEDIFHVDKLGIHLDVFSKIGDCGVVVVETETGHNQEFYDVKSTFNYIVLDGEGSFFLDDEEVHVKKGDSISIAPNTRIYYKGKMRLILITNPPWEAKNEVETRPSVW